MKTTNTSTSALPTSAPLVVLPDDFEDQLLKAEAQQRESNETIQRLKQIAAQAADQKAKQVIATINGLPEQLGVLDLPAVIALIRKHHGTQTRARRRHHNGHIDDAKRAAIIEACKAPNLVVSEVAKRFGTSRQTIYSHMAKAHVTRKAHSQLAAA